MSMREITNDVVRKRGSCGIRALSALSLSILLSSMLSPGAASTDQWKAQAKAANDAGKFREAVRLYSQCLEQKPFNPELLRLRGLAYMGCSEFARARDDFENAGETAGPYEQAETSAVPDGDTGDYPDWLKALVLAQLANRFVERGGDAGSKARCEKAVALYTRALTIRPFFPECWAGRANALNNLGKTGEAKADCLKAIGARPNNRFAWWTLIHVLVKERKQREAQSAFKVFRELNVQGEEDWAPNQDLLKKVGGSNKG